MKCIIVGAGIAGLASAISFKVNCARPDDLEIIILEAAPKLVEVGAGIQINPAISRLLIRWGCEKYLAPLAVEPLKSRIYRWEDGSILTEGPSNINDHMRKTYGSPFWHLHRADLHEGLMKRAEELGVKLYLDHTVESADVYEARVKTTNGREFDCDLIVGCDGIKSQLRNILYEKDVAPQDTPDYCFRFALSTKGMQDDPMLDPLVREPLSILWLGPSRHMVGYQLRHGEMFNIVASFPADNTFGEDGPTSGKAAADEMASMFKGWTEMATTLISKATTITKWKLLDLPTLPTWHKGRLLLAGDACHAALPHLAAGAGQAIEDAAALGILLGNNVPLDILPTVYENLRKSRASQIQAAARKQGLYNHMVDGPQQEERDRQMAKGTLGAMSHTWTEYKSWWSQDHQPEWNEGLFGYDCEKEVLAVLRREKVL